MNAEQSVAASRFHHQWFPDTIFAEPGALSDMMRNELEQKGHRIVVYPSMGRVNAIMYNLKERKFIGCSDPRGYGAAAGY